MKRWCWDSIGWHVSEDGPMVKHEDALKLQEENELLRRSGPCSGLMPLVEENAQLRKRVSELSVVEMPNWIELSRLNNRHAEMVWELRKEKEKLGNTIEDYQESVEVLSAEVTARGARIAALEAENARLRDATRLRPMSDAPCKEVLFMRTNRKWVLGTARGSYGLFGRPPSVFVTQGVEEPESEFLGWIPLPEVQDAQAPDTEHYHE